MHLFGERYRAVRQAKTDMAEKCAMGGAFYETHITGEIIKIIK
jgi:hypothetical protein